MCWTHSALDLQPPSAMRPPYSPPHAPEPGLIREAMPRSDAEIAIQSDAIASPLPSVPSSLGWSRAPAIRLATDLRRATVLERLGLIRLGRGCDAPEIQGLLTV
jgi:hypothetical protein